MTENNNQKFVEFVKSILRKIKPRFSFHYVAYTTLFFLVIFSAIQLVSATTPNPGHPWAEVGDGTFVVTGPSLSRTYTFPDANATILTTNNTVTVAQGGTGQTSIAAGSVWAANSADTLSAITSATGTKILTNTAGTITWEVPASGMVYPGSGIPNSTGSAWGTSYSTIGSGTVLVLATTPTFTTSITTPLVLGGSSTTSDLNLQTTSGVGTTGADMHFLVGSNGGTEAMTILNSGNIGIGQVAPTARLHLMAGTATAGTAPLKFTSGTNLTTAEAGAMEWDGTNLFITQTSGPTRKTLAYTTDIPAASPITIVNSSNLFSTGIYGTGSGVTTTDGSIFLGTSAGDTATLASYSNFLGSNAGYTATSASYSNFLGSNAGYGATNASDSNFFGQGAGSGATDASNSNFLGQTAGSGATNASDSNFFGQGAGNGATDALNSNFLGPSTGSGATNANDSNFFGNQAGLSATSAFRSNFFGGLTGYTASRADNSNFLGYQAGYNATDAASSNFFGPGAGSSATNAFSSNFFGGGAGNAATSASNSNFIGTNAGYDAASASYSNLIGYSAGDSAVNASYSNIIGYKAGKWYSGNQIGSNNIIIGTNISLPNTTANAVNIGGILFATGTYSTTSGNPSITAVSGGKIGIGVVSPNNTLQVANLINFNDTDFNTSIGKNAGANIVTGAQYNTFLGYEAGLSGSGTSTNAADNNTAIGAQSLYSNTTGSSNTANGMYSLYTNTTGSFNTANGKYSLYSNTTGFFNTALGNNSLYSNKTNSRSTAIGYNAMYYADNRTPTGRDTYNTALGVEALRGSTTTANNTGQYNTAIGDSSLLGITSGNYNTALGYQSLYTDTTGGSNTALGMGALYSSTTGDNNVSIGLYSLYNNKANSRSIAIGTNAMYYADDRTSGRVTYNTAIGYEALKGGVTAASNIGQYNTTIGDSSLSANTSGEKNAVIGANALMNNTTGFYNVAIGYNSGRYISAGTANATSNSSIYLGYDTRASADGDTNEIVIGTSTIGNGSNTATIGNTSIVRTYLTGLNLKAGTATAGTAPLKFTSGTNLTATEAGAMEWDGTNLFITQTSGPTRKTIAYTSDITAQVYPGAGIANSTGSSWGTSYTTTGSGSIIALQTSPAFVTSVTGDATFSAFNTTTTNLSIGGAATTLTIGGTPTTAITHNYSTNATAASTTKTVNLGTGGVISSTTNINIGSGYGGITNIKSPTLLVGDSFSSSSLISTPSSSGYAYSLKIAGQSGIDSDGNVYIYGGNTAGMGGGSVFLGHDGASSVGKVFIGNAYNIARLSLPAGTATAGTAPLKFTSGTNLTVAEAGAMEWDGTNLFITQTSGPTRKTIAYTSDIAAQVYPGAGIANSTGSAWGTSYTTTGSGTVVALQTSPAFVTSVTGGASFDVFNTTSTTINAFGAATTLAIGGTPTSSITHNYSTNATSTGNTKTINLGTGGAAGSTTNINIGSNIDGLTTINSPIISVGTIGSGWTEPNTGAGTRLLWYPKKGSFRSGAVSDTQWNDANIGNYSFSSGLNTISSGLGSVAMGYGYTSSGGTANITASNSGSFAGGFSSSADGISNITSSGFGSFAFGYSNASMGTASIVSSGKGSIAMGYATSTNSIQATGDGSIAMGSSVQATQNNALALGVNFTNNTPASFMVGFSATPALTVLNSSIGINNISPTARLHLPAGTVTAGTAPLKFTSGTNLTAAEAGAMEWNGTNLFITQTSGPTRKTIAYTSDITGTAWDAIGDPSGNGAIAFGSTVQTMDWATATTTNPLTLNAPALTTGKLLSLASNTLTSGTLLDLTSAGTGALTNQKGLNIALSGTNGTAAQTTYGAYISNTHAGTTSTNVGLYATASGGTTANYAAIFDGGNVGIGTTTPSEKLDVNGNINIPTTSSTVGIIKQNGTAIFHSYGTENFFLGVSAGNYTLTGQQNTAIGKQAMLNLTSGSYNTAVGYKALYNANSSENAAFGRMALMYANGANNNTAVGNTALGGVSLTGSYNVGIGKDAGRTISSGAHNVFIGYSAGYNGSQLATATNSMALGDQAYTTASNQVVIGASTVTQTLLNGNIGIGTTTTTNIISISGTAAQTIWMERNATAATAGQGLTLSSGGAIAGTADLAGGDLNLKSGISTGTGSSAMRFFTATAGTTGVSDRTPTEKMTILGSGNVGIGDTTPDGTLDIDSSVTTGVNFGITNTGVYTGTGLLSVVADSATTGVVGLMTANGLSSGSILSLTSAGTAALTNQKGLNIALSGTNGTGAQTTYGAYISNTHAGTTSTNVGLYATASGGTTANYSAILVGNMQITGNILPSADDTYTLGSDSYRFSDLFLGPQTLHIGTSTSDEGYISYTTSTNVLKIESIGDLVLQQYVGGMVGIGTGTPSTILDLGSFDNGTLAGPVITLGINNNVTTPAAGAVNFKNNLAVDGYVWQDAGGYLRIFDRQPTAARDTDGTVVGDQTSTRETKQDINDYTDYDMAFSMVINAPLHTFRYKKEVSGYGVDSPLAKERIGFIADEVNQMFMWGNSIDQVSVNGLLMASIKAMDLKIVNINDLEIENTWRDSLIAWLANAENHIARIFTGEICLTEPGQEAVCINRTELQSLKALLIETNTNQGNGNGGVTTEPQATCSDGILNQDETEIDIGGICNSNSTIIPESVEPIITTTNSEPEPTPEIIQNPETATN